jgi:PAS domain S-box-containing protein
MNVYAWASLSASVATLALGTIVYALNKRNVLNKLFLHACLVGFCWTFTEFMMWQAPNTEAANFWSDMGSIWPFYVALVLHFTLLFTQSRWLRTKLTYVALYLPATFFAIVDFSTDLIHSKPALEYWGYDESTQATLVSRASTFWVSLLPILALLICLKFCLKAQDDSKKKQTKYVTIGLGIPIMSYLITDVIFPLFEVNIPDIGHIATLFFAIFVGYAILKYELFTFDAAMAAENIMSTSPDPLFLADMNGKILRTNNRLVDFVGFKENELVGASVSKLCAELDKGSKIIERLAKEKMVMNHELTIKTKIGETKTVLFSGSVVCSRTGRNVGIACALRDITERIEMEKRLVKAERLASIGELAGQIGHDLRNPLTGIKSGFYYLQKKGDKLTGAEREALVEAIDMAVDDSDRIITSLVEYSSDLCLSSDNCTVKSLLTGALANISVPGRITIIDNTTDEFELELAVPEMERVFASLIQNAIEAIPEKGTVEIKSIQKSNNVEVLFVDSGKGIPEDVQRRIFSPLVTTKAKGMGMSLAICKRLVEAYRGKIGFQTTKNKGSTFTITLPLKNTAQFIIQTELAKDEVLA